jgi:hypothetical protein
MDMSQSKLLKVGLAVVLSLMIQNQSFAQDVTYPLTESGVAPPVTPPSSVSEQEVANLLPKGALTSCTMTYKLSGFSLGFKFYDGFGEIQCRNGEHAQVALSSKSIGFSIGKSEIEGEGIFSEVRNLNEIYGDFVSMETHAGFLTSVDAQLLTRGEISLALKGQGRGIDIGATIGDLTIKKR